MVTIILAIILPISIAITGFLVWKSVQLGLRWQVEVRHEKPPTMEKPQNPLEPLQQAKQIKQQESILDEWVNGESR